MWLSAWGNNTVTAKGTEWGMQEWQRGKGRMREGKRRRGRVRWGHQICEGGGQSDVGERWKECCEEGSAYLSGCTQEGVCVCACTQGGGGFSSQAIYFYHLAWTKDVIGSSVLGQIFFMWATKKADSQLSNNNNNGMSQCFQWIGQTGGPVRFMAPGTCK